MGSPSTKKTMIRNGELPPLTFAQGPLDCRTHCLKCDTQGEHSAEYCFEAQWGYHDPDHGERTKYSARRQMMEQGLDFDKIFAETAELLKDHKIGPR